MNDHWWDKNSGVAGAGWGHHSDLWRETIQRQEPDRVGPSSLLPRPILLLVSLAAYQIPRQSIPRSWPGFLPDGSGGDDL